MVGVGKSRGIAVRHPRRPRRAIVLVVLLGLVVVAVAVLTGPDPSHRLLRLHGRSLSAVVSRIKASQREVGKTVLLEVDKSLDPDSIRPFSGEHFDGNRCYWIASCEVQEGDFLVEFPVDDQGHFGLFGFVFSDTPPKIVSRGDYRGTEYGSYLPVITGRQGRHWWYARNFGS